MSEHNAREIWDSHIHILPPSRTRGLVRWIKKAFPDHPSTEDMTPERILSDVRECGVTTVFNMVFPINEDETEKLNEFSREIGLTYDNVVPFGSLHADTPRKDEVAQRCLVECGLAGIKLHPYVQGFEAFSPVFEPLYGKLNELKRPLLVHTGFDVFYNQDQDLDYLRGILERYPGMPVVLVHSLFPRFRLAGELMGEHENLYLDMTNVISAVRFYRDSPPERWSTEVDAAAMADNIDYFFDVLKRYSHRTMFGTDHPAGMGSPQQIYADFDSFDFDPVISANLLVNTARGFLRKCCGREG